MFDLPPPDPGIEVVVASRGYSKGLVQTEGPQIVVRPEVTFGGIYANLLWKNVSSPIVDGEAQINIGYRATLEGFELSGQFGYHRQTGVRAPTDEDRWEANFTARRPVGPLALRLAVTYSPDDFGAIRRSVFLQGGVSLKLSPTITAGTNLGARERVGGPDYRAFDAGISWQARPWLSIDLRGYDTDRSNRGAPFRQRAVISARLRF